MVSGARLVVESQPVLEREVFGVTYERYTLQKLFARLTPKLNVKSVLELPASGAKAMPSLYSLGFARAGCQVTLVDAEEESLKLWHGLGLGDQVSSLTWQNCRASEQRWDLCWNFATLPTAASPEAVLQDMIHATRRWVMVVHVNRFNYGFFLHRRVHRLYKIPWSHGDLRFFSPWRTMAFFRERGLGNLCWGVVDCPPWPDSPGFRDLRLHRQNPISRRWISPYVDYLKQDRFPPWINGLHQFEKLPFPQLLKLPYAHLFYVYGQVNRETD